MKDLNELQKKAMETREKYFGKEIFFYNRPFTPVSLTGSRCELACKHCNRHYLEHMIPVDSREKMRKAGSILKEEKNKGIVLSGGSRKDGSVPLAENWKGVKEMKEKHGFTVNAHTGVLNKEQCEKAAQVIDSALTDVIGSRETIKEILGLDCEPEDYIRTLKMLKEEGVENLTPHVIVGLHHGRIKGEFKALELLRELDLDNIVIVVFIPTEGTEMEKDSPPDTDDVARVAATARMMHPETHISLSCVRPGGRYRLELDEKMVKSGLTKVVLPSKGAYSAAKENNLEITEYKESRCCSF